MQDLQNEARLNGDKAVFPCPCEALTVFKKAITAVGYGEFILHYNTVTMLSD